MESLPNQVPCLGRVLVVDDEETLTSALCAGLQEHGYAASGFTSGTEALAAMREQEFEVLLCDLMMPGMDGTALLKACLESDPHLMGVVMTGQGTVQGAVAAMKQGACDYMLKPFKLAELLPVLAKALELRRLRLENIDLRQTLGLYELTTTLRFTQDLNTILDKIAEVALQQLGADEVSIMLPTQDGRELFVAAVRGGQREHLLGRRVPYGEGIAGWVAHHREPLALEGPVQDGRFGEHHPRADIGTSLSLPMLAAGQLVGVLNLNEKARHRDFTSGDIKALQLLTSIAAEALVASRSNQQAREAEDTRTLFRALIDQSNDAIEVLDPETGRFLDVNEKGCLDLGYSREEFLALSVFDIDPMVDRASFARIGEELRKSGSQLWEGRHRRKNGSTFPVEVNLKYVQLDQNYIVAVVRDISERLQLQAQLHQSQKMEALGQLAGGVAHDFNNLITVIDGYSGLALKHLPREDSLLRSAIEEVQRAGERAEALVRQLLAFSRRQSSEPRVLELNQVVSGVERMLRRLISEDIALELRLAPETGSVEADPGQLEQVLMNLVVNARDAMPQGGQLIIETAPCQLDEMRARSLELEGGSQYCRLSVHDTGVGMSEEVQQHIFEPFFTTKEAGKGTGLGLSTVYGIVKEHRGGIHMCSQQGKGTSFEIYLPLATTGGQEGARQSQASVPRGTETILLVEDDANLRQLIARTLGEVGYTVLEADQGNAALQHCGSHLQTIALLFTDVVLPGVNGYELAAQVGVLRPGTKVLYTSGYAGRGGLPQSTEVRFLAKPFTLENLAHAVRQALDSAPPK